jgi:hypothetical protein
MAYQDNKKKLITVSNQDVMDETIWYYTYVNINDGNNGYKLNVSIKGIKNYLKIDDNPEQSGYSNNIIGNRGNNFTTDIESATVFYFIDPIPINCVGQWSICENNVQTYSLSQEGYFGGSTNCNKDGDTRYCETDTIYLKKGEYKLFVPHFKNDTDMQNDVIDRLGSANWDGQLGMQNWHWATHVHDIIVIDSFKFRMRLYSQTNSMQMTWNERENAYVSNSIESWGIGSKLCYKLHKINADNKYGTVKGRWWLDCRTGQGLQRTWLNIIPLSEYDQYVNGQPNKDSIDFYGS